MPKTYQNSDLSLSILYPDNWIVEEEPDSEAVTLESPDGSFMSVTRVEPSADKDVIGQASEAMAEEYDEIEQEPLSRQVAGVELSGRSLRFVYLDLIVASELLTLESPKGMFLIQIQAEDRAMTEYATVFQAMLVSLAQSLDLA